jgi:hypothetical protein
VKSIRVFLLPVFCGLMSATLFGGDLSTYRNFKIGMDLPTVARMARTNASQAKTIQQRPALIQEIEWHPGLFDASTQDEAAKDVLFSFYNGELFQIAVNYDRYKTEGMKSQDLIDAISATYGTAASEVPAANVVSPDAYVADRTETIARWGDGEYGLSLVRFEYGPSFGLILVSNRVDQLARAAIIEATRLDLQEAPQREAERLKKQAEDDRAMEGKARLANKPKFRP